jgi:surface protein
MPLHFFIFRDHFKCISVLKSNFHSFAVCEKFLLFCPFQDDITYSRLISDLTSTFLLFQIKMSMEWPTDILLQFVQTLAGQCDIRAQRAWNQLAFLTCNRAGLARYARSIPRPILLRIGFSDEAPSRTFKIPFTQATAVCVDIDWGDGSVDKLRDKGSGFIEHEYTAAGEYSVRIIPADAKAPCLDHLGFQKDADEDETEAWWRPLREIVSLGRCGLQSLSYLFKDCLDLQADISHLDVSDILDMSGMFFACSSFNQPIGQWNVSNVTNMSQMFNGASVFDQPIGEWNVGNVAKMRHMFSGAVAFNQPIGGWNVQEVISMAGIFTDAETFNQPICEWNVGNVTDLSYAFHRALAFNQPIGNWNVSNVVKMIGTFSYMPLFNQPIGDWNVGNVRNQHV